MKVAIATDHNGVEQKSDLIFFLGTKGIEVLDMSKDNNPVDDYPDFAFRVEEAFLARQHNNANIIALSYKAPMDDLKIMIDKFVSTDFAHDERHVRRLKKISEYEEQ